MFGTPADWSDPALNRVFPAPEILAGADLLSLGMPAATRRRGTDPRGCDRGGRARARRRPRPRCAGRPSSLRSLASAPGPRTTSRSRACGEPDAFPAGDLGLRRAAGNGHGPVDERELLDPSRGVATVAGLRRDAPLVLVEHSRKRPDIRGGKGYNRSMSTLEHVTIPSPVGPLHATIDDGRLRRLKFDDGRAPGAGDDRIGLSKTAGGLLRRRPRRPRRPRARARRHRVPAVGLGRAAVDTAGRDRLVPGDRRGRRPPRRHPCRGQRGRVEPGGRSSSRATGSSGPRAGSAVSAAGSTASAGCSPTRAPAMPSRFSRRWCRAGSRGTRPSASTPASGVRAPAGVRRRSAPPAASCGCSGGSSGRCARRARAR